MTPDAKLRMDVYQEGQRAYGSGAICPYTDWRQGTWTRGWKAAADFAATQRAEALKPASTQQPEALRLADALGAISVKSSFAERRLDQAAAILRTQYALLGQARDVLESARKVAYMGGAGTCDEMEVIDATLAAITQHLEPK